MPPERFRLISDEELLKRVTQYRVETGQVTREEFASKPPEEQELIREALFETYARNVNPHISLSAIEFTLVALAKLLFRITEKAELTPEEQEFYNQFKAVMEAHEMQLDVNDWHFSYLVSQLEKVRQNRAIYKAKKLEITGEG